MSTVSWGIRYRSIHQRAFVKYYSGHFSAHYRGVLISPVTVTKQHHLSTGKTGCLILALNKWRCIDTLVQTVEESACGKRLLTEIRGK